MTLSDLYGLSPTAILFKIDYLHICAAVDNILTNLESYAVPMVFICVEHSWPSCFFVEASATTSVFQILSSSEDGSVQTN